MEAIMEAIDNKFTEMFKKHEDTMLQIIAANHKIGNQRIDKIMEEINGFKESLEFTQKNTEEELKNSDKKIKVLEEEIDKLKEIPRWGEEIKNKMVEQEDRSRRNNLRFEGIPETEGESWDDCANKVVNFLQERLQMKTDFICIERAHRGGRTVQGKPRVIVAKFLNYNDKSSILLNCAKLKNTPYCLYEDFSKETTEIRKEKWKQVQINRKNNKISYLNYRSVVCRDKKY
jgi:hypothetical protein